MATAGLHRHGALATRAHIYINDPGRTRECGIEPRRAHRPFDDYVAWRFRMHAWRRGCKRRVDIDHRIFGIDVDQDIFREVLRLGRILCDDHRDRLADMGDAVSRQRGLRIGNLNTQFPPPAR